MENVVTISSELEKNGLSFEILEKLSYKSKLERSLKHSLGGFDKSNLFAELKDMIGSYNLSEELDLVDLDYRIKSIDSCIRKYKKFYPNMELERTFNDILGFRMLCDSYDFLFAENTPENIRIVDMRKGKAHDDGYRGVHVYFQLNHRYYPIEIQVNTYYDRQINNWLHKHLYKKGYPDDIGAQLRNAYEYGKIVNEKEFEEVLRHVLSSRKTL